MTPRWRAALINLTMLLVVIVVGVLVGWNLTDTVNRDLAPKAWLKVTAVEESSAWFNFTMTFQNVTTPSGVYIPRWSWEIEGNRVVDLKGVSFHTGDIIIVTILKSQGWRHSKPWLITLTGGDLWQAVEIELGKEFTVF